MTTLKGVVRGRMIELDQPPGLPDGSAVLVSIQRTPPAPPRERMHEVAGRTLPLRIVENERAEALISIAHPDFRAELRRDARLARPG